MKNVLLIEMCVKRGRSHVRVLTYIINEQCFMIIWPSASHFMFRANTSNQPKRCLFLSTVISYHLSSPRCIFKQLALFTCLSSLHTTPLVRSSSAPSHSYIEPMYIFRRNVWIIVPSTFFIKNTFYTRLIIIIQT